MQYGEPRDGYEGGDQRRERGRLASSNKNGKGVGRKSATDNYRVHRQEEELLRGAKREKNEKKGGCWNDLERNEKNLGDRGGT